MATAALVLLLLSGKIGAQPTYSFVSTTSPGMYYPPLGGHLVNNWGQVVGTYITGTEASHLRAFLSDVVRGSDSSQRKTTDIGTLPAPYTNSSVATAINDLGQVVGYSSAADGTSHAFIWERNAWTGKAAITDLGTLPAPHNSYCAASDINAWGQVVGYCSAGLNNYHAFLWQRNLWTGKASIKDIGTLPSPFDSGCAATAINDLGQIVGYCTLANSFGASSVWGSYLPVIHAVLWKGEAIRDLGTLPGPPETDHLNTSALSMALDINNRGQVVGLSSISNSGGPTHAIMWREDVIVDIGAQFSPLQSVAFGINDLGQVVGESLKNSSIDALLWQKGDGDGLTVTDLGLEPLPGPGVHAGSLAVRAYTSARSINNRSQIAGLALERGIVLWSLR